MPRETRERPIVVTITACLCLLAGGFLLVTGPTLVVVRGIIGVGATAGSTSTVIGPIVFGLAVVVIALGYLGSSWAPGRCSPGRRRVAEPGPVATAMPPTAPDDPAPAPAGPQPPTDARP